MCHSRNSGGTAQGSAQYHTHNTEEFLTVGTEHCEPCVNSQWEYVKKDSNDNISKVKNYLYIQETLGSHLIYTFLMAAYVDQISIRHCLKQITLFKQTGFCLLRNNSLVEWIKPIYLKCWSVRVHSIPRHIKMPKIISPQKYFSGLRYLSLGEIVYLTYTANLYLCKYVCMYV